MEESMMGEGIKLLFMGMGGVFIFLSIMVLFMNISASFFKKYAHLFPEDEKKSSAPAAKADGHEDIAVVLAAVTSYSK